MGDAASVGLLEKKYSRRSFIKGVIAVGATASASRSTRCRGSTRSTRSTPTSDCDGGVGYSRHSGLGKRSTS